ncbi:MAG: twin-arginine translocation signal domain-containing protein, partial [Bacteroidetes bacterium]|nr:twin-arginine translocation signal domain-containing protein [Bacteroidota bacterium]
MSTNRREFLKRTGLAGISLAGAGLVNGCTNTEKSGNLAHIQKQSLKGHQQTFNMSGYAAPKMETVRVGIIGLGMRGPGAVQRLSYLEGVEIKALCDIGQEQVAAAQKLLANTSHQPATYSGSEEA